MEDRYLELLSDFDLRILGTASELVHPDQARAWFRARRDRVTTALAKPETFAALFPREQFTGTQRACVEQTSFAFDHDGISIVPSAFLFFSVLVHRGATDLLDESLRVERVGNRTFAKVGPPQRGSVTANSPALRLFVAELLDSFSPARATHAWPQITDGHQGVVDEQSPTDLVRVLRQINPQESAGLYRRLGDLALFRTGFSQVESTLAPLKPADVEELTASLPDGLAVAGFSQQLVELFASLSQEQVLGELGPIWFRMAAHRVGIPALSNPLTQVADNFDDAAGFLHHLATVYGLHRSAALVGRNQPST